MVYPIETVGLARAAQVLETLGLGVAKQCG
jgi:hypothetical protein